MTVAKAIVKRATKKSKDKVNATKLLIKQFNKSTYMVAIKNLTHFALEMDHVSINMSFQ